MLDNFDNFPKGRNPYFDYRNPAYDKEKNLFSLWATESINRHGVCMEYYQTTYDTTYDKIWGEDNNRRFVKKFDIMVYYQLPKEEKMWTKFGIEHLDTFSMFCSKRHFRAASKSPGGGVEVIPKIGDIIIAKYDPSIYEITEVVEEVSMFLQSKQHVWEFVVKSFVNEHIDLPNSMSATTISNYINKDDIFDIANDIDILKENIVYKPNQQEKSNNDPFVSF